ncbi:small integral membrane protein 30 [Gadus morhua]|jgi:hypothetical protein|uniref:small integral membrane protein 30 n=1 Tax=Gadus morhua TaxID=8049 RepID=UPI0011B81DBA|nr:small integral membrane protein 30 [Gadus morhua]XP_059894057.1 small integral membrane protein 30-like [Gadus macrocephalus]
MAAKLQLSNAAVTIFLGISTLITPAEAYDAGDGIAWLLGTVIAVVGLCACLGWYSRSRNRQF